ncbi:MAG: NAD-binding protein [Campylobacterales bacterium]|nr:NAD-binding protein [Campylobacterales bacterium]
MILVFGYNKISKEIIKNLQDNKYDFTVLDKSEDLLKTPKNLGYKTQVVDINDDDSLTEVGIGLGKIKTIFVFFQEEIDNIFVTISARAIDKDLRIISLTNKKETSQKLIAAGANKVIDPYEISGRKIYEILTKPDVVEILDRTLFGKKNLNIAEIVIPKGSFLEGKTLDEELIDRKYHLLTIAITDYEKSSDLIFISESHHHKLDEGDIVVVIGKLEDIENFKKDLQR